MSLISRTSNTLILNNVLLDNCGSLVYAEGLVIGFYVSVSGWNKTVVAWDMSGHLGGTNSQFILLVLLRRGIMW